MYISAVNINSTGVRRTLVRADIYFYCVSSFQSNKKKTLYSKLFKRLNLKIA